MARHKHAPVDMYAPEVAWTDARTMGDLVNEWKQRALTVTAELLLSERARGALEYRLKQLLESRRGAV